MKPKLFIIALLALLAASCMRDTLPELEKEGAKVVTIKVDIAPETRLAYHGGIGENALSWQENDQIMLIGFDDSNLYQGHTTFTMIASGLFQGNTVPGATKYKAFYPVSSVRLDQNGDPILENGNPSMPAHGSNFWRQTQVGNNSAAHIGNNLVLWDTEANSINQTFNLALKSSIIKLDLSGIPEDAGKLYQLIYTVETASGVFKSVSIDVTGVTFSASTSSLTAFLSFDPTVMTNTVAGGKVIIRLKGNKLYQWSQIVTLGKEYAAGNCYTGAVSSGWADITTPLYYVAEYNVIQAGDSFVTDLTSCSGSGYFNWNDADSLFRNTTIGGLNYHLPSDSEWFGIVPKYVKTGYYVHFKTEYSYDDVYESVKVRSEFFNVYSNFRTTPNNISYALRYRNTVWYSAWRYEYIADGNNTHMKITSRKVASSVTVGAIAQESFWASDTEKDIVRYFPASGYESSGSYSYQGERGYFWSSTAHSSNNSYAWYMLFNTDRSYSNNTPKIFKNTVRLFYD